MFTIRLRVALLIIPLITIFVTTNARAQESNFYSMYFQNQYLTNPAMAGLEKGLHVNIGYQQPSNAQPGSIKLQYGTADYNAGANVGLGINVFNLSLGLTTDTRAMFTYAYHLPVSEEENLNFGLSLGFNDTYIPYSEIVGVQSDPLVGRYNGQPIYVDGDFGASFTGKQLTIQAMLPNLKSLFFNGNGQDLQIDKSLFLASVSYKFMNEGDNNYTFEPIAAYHNIRSFANIVSAGFNYTLTDYDFNVSGMYHSDQTATFGLGLDLKNIILLLAYTNDFSALKIAEKNTFEIGLKVNFLNK